MTEEFSHNQLLTIIVVMNGVALAGVGALFKFIMDIRSDHVRREEHDRLMDHVQLLDRKIARLEERFGFHVKEDGDESRGRGREGI